MALIDDDYAALIRSDRVGARTREVLEARDVPDDPEYQPAAVLPEQMPTLRAVLDRVLPLPDGVRIDLAARIDAALDRGDGWRFVPLPPDPEAFRAALRTLDAAARAGGGVPFARLDAAGQDAMLACAADGALDAGAGPGLLAADAMRLWFEDLRASAAKVFVSHPAALARMGYSGIAYGGDGPRKQGFVRIGIGEREAWEPVAPGDLAPGTPI